MFAAEPIFFTNFLYIHLYLVRKGVLEMRVLFAFTPELLNNFSMKLTSTVSIRVFLIVIPFGHPICASLGIGPTNKTTSTCLPQSSSLAHPNDTNDIKEQKEEYAPDGNSIADKPSSKSYCILKEKAVECMNVHEKTIYYGVKKRGEALPSLL